MGVPTTTTTTTNAGASVWLRIAQIPSAATVAATEGKIEPAPRVSSRRRGPEGAEQRQRRDANQRNGPRPGRRSGRVMVWLASRRQRTQRLSAQKNRFM